MPLDSRHDPPKQPDASSLFTMASATQAPADAGNHGAPAAGAARKPAICPTDDDAITPSSHEPTRAKIDKRSTEYLVKSGVAGGLAGCAAKTVVAPLDRVKILFQTSNPQFLKYTGSWTGAFTAMRNIYNNHGTRGLFRGHSATLLRIFPYAGIKFLAYEQVRAVVIPDKSRETPVRRFASGSLAGLLSVFFTYPLEVVRVRLAFDTTKEGGRYSLVGVWKQIYQEKAPTPTSNPVPFPSPTSNIPRAAATAASMAAATVEQVTPRSGLANFYRGFTPTLWGMLPYAGASFLTHDVAHDVLRRPAFAPYTTMPDSAKRSVDPNKPTPLKVWAQLLAGGAAGFVSQTISYPLEVVRRRMQVGGVVGDGRRLGMAEVAGRIWMEKGLRGFFVGLGIGYVKVIPMTATSFFVYERAKWLFGI